VLLRWRDGHDDPGSKLDERGFRGRAACASRRGNSGGTTIFSRDARVFEIISDIHRSLFAAGPT